MSDIDKLIENLQLAPILISPDGEIDLSNQAANVIEMLQTDNTMLKAENEHFLKCCCQRGARMQILYSQVKGTNRNIMVEEMDAFFDKDGVPL